MNGVEMAMNIETGIMKQMPITNEHCQCQHHITSNSKASLHHIQQNYEAIAQIVQQNRGTNSQLPKHGTNCRSI